MKIAFIAQPFDVLLPNPKNSISIWVDEISSKIVQNHEAVVYSAKTDSHDRFTQKNNVRHIGISTVFDKKIIEIIKTKLKPLRIITRNICKSSRNR